MAHSSSPGFTFIELLVVAAISIIIATLSLPSLTGLRERGMLDASAARITGALEDAHTLTLAGKDGIVHGVHLEPTRVTLFSGSVYDVSDPDNRIIELGAPITVTSIPAVSDIVFDKGMGRTDQQYTIIVALAANAAKNRTVVVYPTGRIQTP